ncbi:MAG: c-type cytochrome [Myxococcales bacterium]|nr:c-type cytochrome [Myxococcales bacterium]
MTRGSCVLFLALWGCGSQAPECPPCASASVSAASVSASAKSAAPASGPSTADATQAAELTFRKEGERVVTLTLSDLTKAIPAETVKQLDPYYNKEKSYRAVPLAAVIELAFKGEKDLPQKEYVLRAKDGYTVPLRGSKVFEKGAFIAFQDVEVPGWEPIGQQRANPAPFYLVWAGKDQTDLETHPRPYQLAAIEIARFEDVFPRTVPKGLAADSPAQKGFALFREQCIHCHAINREGGRVGPELNVPQSVVEYRPVDQIKAYIKDPLTFRYSTMPAHPSFTDADLDAIVAYFTAMKDRKQDDAKTSGK